MSGNVHRWSDGISRAGRLWRVRRNPSASFDRSRSADRSDDYRYGREHSAAFARSRRDDGHGPDRHLRCRSVSDTEDVIRKYLSDDHARLDAALQGGDYESFREGLLRHIGIEQKILFPIVRGWPLVERLHLDHGALAALLVPTPTPAILNAIRTILQNHNPLEEGHGGLYEECERLLGPDVPQVLTRLQNAPPVPVAKHVDNQISMDSARAALQRAGYTMTI